MNGKYSAERSDARLTPASGAAERATDGPVLANETFAAEMLRWLGRLEDVL
jgi:hypothetical protein